MKKDYSLNPVIGKWLMKNGGEKSVKEVKNFLIRHLKITKVTKRLTPILYFIFKLSLAVVTGYIVYSLLMT